MGNVSFTAPVQLSTGSRYSFFQTQETWMPANVVNALLPLRISYPRPISERTGFLNSPVDKWLTGVAWELDLGIMYGAYPYQIKAIRGDLDETAFTIDNTNLRVSKTFATPGTYNFTIYVVDSMLAFASVAISLVVHDAAAGNILDHFRVIDFDSGVNGSGTLASPFNAWSSFWGTDWNVVIADTIIPIMFGTATITNLTLSNEPAAARFGFGDNRPRALIADRLDSNVTLDLLASGKHIQPNTAARTDITWRGWKTTGVRGVDASCFRASQFGHRTTIQNTTHSSVSLEETAVNNSGVFGSNGAQSPQYVTFTGTTFSGIQSVGTTGACFLGFYFSDLLFDRILCTSIGNSGSNKISFLLKAKHESTRVEFRRVTCIDSSNGTTNAFLQLADTSDPNHYNPLIRFCNLRTTGTGIGSANDIGVNFNDLQISNNTLVCNTNTILTFGNIVNSEAWITRNLIESTNTVQDSFGTIDAGVSAVTGKPGILDDNVRGNAGTLVDANGIPLSPSHYGYGHYLP